MKNKMEKEIYLDNAATTKVDEKVAQAVKEFMVNYYANPSSGHWAGKKVREKIEVARQKIANYIGAETEEIIFTSGGTESNNLAIKGLAKAYPEKKHIITTNIEHKSILEVCKALEKEGYEVDYVKVDEKGIVKVSEIKSRIRKDTLVVSVMHVNNEIGTIEPVQEIGKLCREQKVFFHSDCVQSFRKLDIDVSKTNIDLLSVSGHKVNAPKGIGFLYIKNGIKISPILNGGGQERGFRSGTENVLGIIGIANSLEIKINKEKIKESRDYILEELLKIPGTKLNGSLEKRIFNNINISFYGIDGGSLVSLLSKEGVFVSTGSACTSGGLNESHVLSSLGVDPIYIHGTIRLSLGELSRKEEAFVIEKIKSCVSKLREISPFKVEDLENKTKIGENKDGN